MNIMNIAVKRLLMCKRLNSTMTGPTSYFQAARTRVVSQESLTTIKPVNHGVFEQFNVFEAQDKMLNNKKNLCVTYKLIILHLLPLFSQSADQRGSDCNHWSKDFSCCESDALIMF